MTHSPEQKMLHGIDVYRRTNNTPELFIERLVATVTDFDWSDHPTYKNATISEFIYIVSAEKLYMSPVHFCALVKCAMLSEP